MNTPSERKTEIQQLNFIKLYEIVKIEVMKYIDERLFNDKTQKTKQSLDRIALPRLKSIDNRWLFSKALREIIL